MSKKSLFCTLNTIHLPCGLLLLHLPTICFYQRWRILVENLYKRENLAKEKKTSKRGEIFKNGKNLPNGNFQKFSCMKQNILPNGDNFKF
jgi:hypothetical protein